MIPRARKITVLLIVSVLLLQACGLGGNENTNGNSATIPPTPGGPGGVGMTTTETPDVEAAAKAYLDAWAGFEYQTMYGMLASLSQDAISYEAFETRYQDVAREASLTSIEYDILQSLKNPNSAQAAYRITLNSALVGPISRETRMSFTLENGAWRVIWDDSIILPELAGGNLLSMQVFTPTRGIIYDRNGDPLSAYTDAVAISVIPSNIDEDSASGLVAQLSTLTGIPSGYLSTTIFADDAPFLTPIAVVPADVFEARSPFLEPYFNMLSWTDYFTRLSYNGNAGANTLGYVSSIPAEEADAWAQLGYPIDAIVGRDGLEGWGEEYLAGKRGGELYVVSPDRQTRITILNSQEAQPSDSIYSTLDSNLQFYAQLALGDFTGSVIVMERDTGRILAMASSPTYDPNDADFNNPNSVWGSYFDGSTDRPFLNRATQGQYPPGSIFKIITMAAALESGLYTPQSTFLCSQTWDKIGTPLENWTVEKGLPADGELTLQQGLMRSCNPWFFEIGWTLYGNGEFSLVADLARAFGLGSPTGLQELPEAAGQITNPDQSTTGSDPVFNAVQQAIGQSDTLISPIQALVYVAAVGNGGNLLQPQLTERIVDTGGTVIQSFEPIVTGTLPISEETLFAIQTAMRMVINQPRGTAYRTFANMTTQVYGKTGTAQNPGEDPHAWFIGYTNAGRNDLPDIAIVVMLENIGDGSEFAAPVFRRMVEVYFTGIPQRSYPWENQIGVIDEEYFLPPEEEGNEEDGAVELTPSP